MNKLLKLVQLGLRSHSVFSHIEVLLIIISRLVSFGLLQHTNVREAFSCVPMPNTTIEQLCYHNYTSSYNRIFVAVLIADGLFYLTWIIFAVYGAFVLRNLKHNGEGLSYPCSKSITFRGAYISALGFRCKAALLMTVYTGQFVSVPSPYKCPLPSDTAPMLFNQTQNELFCHDQRYKAKTNLKINLLTINVFILCLCITELVYITAIPLEKILYKVLGADVSTNRELPAVRYSVNSLQERPPSTGDPAINCESSITECGTQNIENRSCEQSDGETADGHTHVIVLVYPSVSPDNRHRAWQESKL